MRRKSFRDMQCPIARSLERVGEWWSMLILRDALLGLTRFDQCQENPRHCAEQGTVLTFPFYGEHDGSLVSRVIAGRL